MRKFLIGLFSLVAVFVAARYVPWGFSHSEQNLEAMQPFRETGMFAFLWDSSYEFNLLLKVPILLMISFVWAHFLEKESRKCSSAEDQENELIVNALLAFSASAFVVVLGFMAGLMQVSGISIASYYELCLPFVLLLVVFALALANETIATSFTIGSFIALAFVVQFRYAIAMLIIMLFTTFVIKFVRITINLRFQPFLPLG